MLIFQSSVGVLALFMCFFVFGTSWHLYKSSVQIAEGMVQWVKCWPCKHEGLSSNIQNSPNAECGPVSLS